MSKRRLKFSKTGMGKYISHLDLLRTFTRAIHRAELPVRYSQGFNPHQLITFSLPLPIGVTSETEFVDVDFEDSADNAEIMKRLNENLPPDIKILSVSMPECKANDITAARYTITVRAADGISEENIARFFALEDIPVVKKTKKGEKTVNLHEYIKRWSVTECTAQRAVLDVTLAAGGAANIKPEFLVAELEKFLGIGELDGFDIHRTQIFYNDGEVFC